MKAGSLSCCGSTWISFGPRKDGEFRDGDRGGGRAIREVEAGTHDEESKLLELVLAPGDRARCTSQEGLPDRVVSLRRGRHQHGRAGTASSKERRLLESDSPPGTLRRWIQCTRASSSSGLGRAEAARAALAPSQVAAGLRACTSFSPVATLLLCRDGESSVILCSHGLLCGATSKQYRQLPSFVSLRAPAPSTRTRSCRQVSFACRRKPLDQVPRYARTRQ